MNICDVLSTITTKSVRAGEYTCPPAAAPMISEICGMTPEACTVRRKISVEPQRDDTFLDPGAATLIDTHHGRTVPQRDVEDLRDLLAVNLAEAAAEDGHVL